MEPRTLSIADSLVLAHVFDPEAAPTRTEVVIDPYLPADRHITDSRLLADLREREKRSISFIESYEKAQSGPSQRETAYRSALGILDEIIAENPLYASAWNNRAQLRRWRFGDRNMLCQKRQDTGSERLQTGSRTVRDLQESIRLASPRKSTDAVSPVQGRLLGQAYTQLAAMYWAASKDSVPSGGNRAMSPEIEGWDKDRLEEEGSRCFFMGGLYGNEVAKALAVHTNPHAKLCGSIVREAMKKEFAAAV